MLSNMWWSKTFDQERVDVEYASYRSKNRLRFSLSASRNIDADWVVFLCFAFHYQLKVEDRSSISLRLASFVLELPLLAYGSPRQSGPHFAFRAYYISLVDKCVPYLSSPYILVRKLYCWSFDCMWNGRFPRTHKNRCNSYRYTFLGTFSMEKAHAWPFLRDSTIDSTVFHALGSNVIVDCRMIHQRHCRRCKSDSQLCYFEILWRHTWCSWTTSCSSSGHYHWWIDETL